ncbi:IS110 family transposase [Mesorhizobium sp.]|uniref:IS110 family transposase n=1 Tax=Mesorhizobium sp. TaxID=1871066 RepID=UPI0025E28D72|nr:IS110 family transposase [Mesorhizobium sp.]
MAAIDAPWGVAPSSARTGPVSIAAARLSRRRKMSGDISAFVGVDWASATHYALDADGRKLGHRSFPHSGEGLAELANWIRSTTGHDPDRVAIGIEVPHGPVVEGLMDAGFLVHAINPKQLDGLRDRFTMAGAKDDRLDAFVLADALRTDRKLYRFPEPMHPTVIELREWSRMTEDLSAERNRLANRFRHQLWRYYPQVLELAEDCSRAWVLDLWELIPTPAKARTVRAATVAKQLKQPHIHKSTWIRVSFILASGSPRLNVFAD